MPKELQMLAEYQLDFISSQGVLDFGFMPVTKKKVRTANRKVQGNDQYIREIKGKVFSNSHWSCER